MRLRNLTYAKNCRGDLFWKPDFCDSQFFQFQPAVP